MRVIAGEYGGRRLASPKGEGVRPTTDRVKEAIFSMAAPYIEGAVCLDLFAGTGALGIEALSRGAKRVYFCDAAHESQKIVRENIETCRIEKGRAVLYACDWRTAIARLAAAASATGPAEKCSLVFIDAPYEMYEKYPQILAALSEHGTLGHEARIVLERDAKHGGYGLPEGFEREREKRYGGTGVDLLVFRGSGAWRGFDYS